MTNNRTGGMIIETKVRGENMGTKRRENLEQFNRQNIITAARELFAQKGVDATTVDDICKKADCSKSTIYVYFKSKHEIYTAIVLEHMKLLHDGISQCLLCLGFRQKFKAICEMLVKFNRDYPIYFESVLGNISVDAKMLQSDSLLLDIYNIGENINSLLETAIKEGVAQKEIREDIDAKPTMMVMWASICAVVSMSVNKREYIESSMKMSCDEFENLGFSLIYASIERKSEDGTH